MSETGLLNPSENFTWDQMSNPYFPDPISFANQVALCEQVMEPIRSLFIQPISISKGFDPTDQLHTDGSACDFNVPGVSVNDAMACVQANSTLIPFNTINLEMNDNLSWHVHISIAAAPEIS